MYFNIFNVNNFNLHEKSLYRINRIIGIDCSWLWNKTQTTMGMLNYNSKVNHIVPITNTKNISEHRDSSGLKWLNPKKYT